MGADNRAHADTLAVEVACATPEKQCVIRLKVVRGTTALQAVRKSGIADEFPELDTESSPMGIFSMRLDGRRLPLPSEYVLQARDRVEIYRPLLIDPKQARLNRVARNNN
ncbi:MAG: RnfH family protein [Gammaproteobacteria bacterium]|nr:RnfH family protein [Gammaproteobacteria bacterium]